MNLRRVQLFSGLNLKNGRKEAVHCSILSCSREEHGLEFFHLLWRMQAKATCHQLNQEEKILLKHDSLFKKSN